MNLSIFKYILYELCKLCIRHNESYDYINMNKMFTSDSKYIYFGANFVKHVRCFDLLLQILMTQIGTSHVILFQLIRSKVNFDSWSHEQYISRCLFLFSGS